ncbi:isoleucine--tRNA ligase [Rhodopirellula sallentina]|uniref:Isoleucine--tRNA ligase n=1 Tax=Rhodopirellula sallentina SM41 TaxID=1263870 RepID=M5U2K2_9BACT|nr:isoleucine--tRNA ligase [Rhodopirellula sallentina]EMI52086.1 isoleucyl-tRNA synthetase 2 [Rhodopirellula sallentina SM41]
MTAKPTPDSNSASNAPSDANSGTAVKAITGGAFAAVSASPSFPSLEEEVLSFWDQQQIYEKSLARRADAPTFVFFEGPPTANGMPHPGHCLTRAIKDVFPRYKTMRGYRCERKAGWDTHGLPVEVEVGKELGIHSKEEIEAYGVEPFIQKCQQSVWRYMREWETLTRRLGFWVDLKQAYVTYHQSYVESVWWSLKNLFDRGLLYQGHKIVWWWAQGGTALSAGEVGQGYREVADPSVYVLFPLVTDDAAAPKRSLVVWTTTPWTLPSNMYAAVKSDLEYSVVEDSESGEQLVLASALVETLAGKIKRELKVIETVSGASLVGQRYEPPFADYRERLSDPQGKLKTGEQEYLYWRVVAADFVTTESGSGLVHLAPAFGEVDYEVLVEERDRFVETDRPDLLCAVGPDGKFTDEFPSLKGEWVKSTDKTLTRQLRDNGRLLHQEQYLHDYPFCWRADDDPLIQYPRESWFIRTTKFRDLMLKNNSQIGWQPEHIRDGRFGNFLDSNVDWALSRERYWGTPLPIWVCQSTGRMEAVASYDELLAKPGVEGTDVWDEAKKANPELADDLRVHKPYIDAVTYESPFESGARMKRVSEVIDCWYDSGAMPFAQWGWPHQNDDRFAEQFPADFISEAIDQTRGWFYSQLAISTMLFGEGASVDASDAASETDAKVGESALKTAADQSYPHPYRNCIVLGLMLSQWYEATSKESGSKIIALTEEETAEHPGVSFTKKTGKMSKQLRNYRSPSEIFDRYGADAMRWYFFANQAPWNSIIYADGAIRDSIPEFLLRLWNTFSFFTIYAEIDGFDPTTASEADEQLSPESLASAPTYRPIAERSEIDRWIVSETNVAIETIVQRMDDLDNYNACQAITSLLDGLSNWYVRRSRDRYWAKDAQSQDKHDAYWTLYETLLQLTKVIAPFVPFLSEKLWQELTRPFGDRVLDSVHLCDYPVADSSRIDASLSESMKVLREIASLGRSARADAKMKVRLPLSAVEVILTDDSQIAWLQSHDSLVREELNVKSVEYTTDGGEYVQYSVVPNFKRLGPKVGKQIPAVKKLLGEADGNQLLGQLQTEGKVALTMPDGSSLELDSEDIEVRLKAREGWAAAQGPSCVVVLNTEVTDELRREGIAKDLIRAIQSQRKSINCEYTDRIEIGITTDDAETQKAIEMHQNMICEETLADRLVLEALPNIDPTSIECGELYVAKVSG